MNFGLEGGVKGALENGAGYARKEKKSPWHLSEKLSKVKIWVHCCKREQGGIKDEATESQFRSPHKSQNQQDGLQKTRGGSGGQEENLTTPSLGECGPLYSVKTF